MPNTSRMSWPYPSEHLRRWYSSFEDFAGAQDASAFAARVDRNQLVIGGGELTFTLSTGALAWAEDIDFPSPITGFKQTLIPASVNMIEGDYLYVSMVRNPLTNQTLTPTVSQQVPSSDNDFVIAIRVNNRLYFRNGLVLRANETYEVFASPTNAFILSREKLSGYGQTDGTVPLLILPDQFPLDPSIYSAGSVLTFVAVLSTSGPLIEGGVYLYNVTDAEIVASSQVVTTEGSPTVLRAILTQADVPGSLWLSEKVYEIRLTNNGSTGGDLVTLGSAYLEVTLQ